MYTILRRVSKLKVQSALVLFVFIFLISNKGYSQTDCSSTSFPAIQFTDRNTTLTSTMMTALTSIAGEIKNHPDCRYVIMGNGGTTKIDQEIAWLRGTAVTTYLNDHEGININRFIFRIDGDPSSGNVVTIRGAAADDEGLSTMPEPHPGLIAH